MEKTINIPNNLGELTLEQFCEAYQLINNPNFKNPDDTPKESFWFEYIHILTKIPKEDLDNMDYIDFIKMKKIVIDLKFDIPNLDNQDEDRKDIIVEHKGKRFIFQPDYAYNKLKTARLIEDYLGEKDFLEHLYLVAGIGFIELDDKNNPKPFIIENLNKKAEFWLDCPIEKLYSTLFFYSIQGNASLMLTNRFGKMTQNTKRWAIALLQQGAIQELKKLNKNGVGLV